MLEIVSKGFANAKAALTGRTTLTAENVDAAVRAIRVSLLEADVELSVVRAFLGRVKERAIGEVITTEVNVDGQKRRRSPADHFAFICYNELVALMGSQLKTPIVYHRPVTVLMMVGLQGVGKTTTCGKMAKYLLGEKRRPLLVGADIYRPAAQAQLRILGEKLGVPVFAPAGQSPVALCRQALAHARAERHDVVILDTAGRLAIDDALMGELDEIKAACKPHEILLVTDAMAGQDSVRTAKAFDDRLALSGLVMTKLDGDARGGAALSMKEVLGKPIKFLGTGEALDKLERFRPEGLASRILGMGDLVGLMQDFEQVVDEKKAEADAKKLLRGQFTLDDFLVQLGHLQKLGPIKDVLAKMPMMGGAGAMPQVDDKTFVGMRAMIQSMTAAERRAPAELGPSNVRRIAKGSGRKEEDVRGLIERFTMMQRMMAQLRGPGGLAGMMPNMRQMAKAARQQRGKGGGAPELGGLGGLGGGMPPFAPPGAAGPGASPAGAGGPAGGLGGRLAKLAKRAGGALPGLPGLPGLGAEGPSEPAGGESMGGMPDFSQLGGWPGAARGPADAKSRQKLKDKRKAERKARKKARR